MKDRTQAHLVGEGVKGRVLTPGPTGEGAGEAGVWRRGLPSTLSNLSSFRHRLTESIAMALIGRTLAWI